MCDPPGGSVAAERDVQSALRPVFPPCAGSAEALAGRPVASTVQLELLKGIPAAMPTAAETDVRFAEGRSPESSAHEEPASAAVLTAEAAMTAAAAALRPAAAVIADAGIPAISAPAAMPAAAAVPTAAAAQEPAADVRFAEELARVRQATLSSLAAVPAPRPAAFVGGSAGNNAPSATEHPAALAAASAQMPVARFPGVIAPSGSSPQAASASAVAAAASAPMPAAAVHFTQHVSPPSFAAPAPPAPTPAPGPAEPPTPVAPPTPGGGAFTGTVRPDPIGAKPASGAPAAARCNPGCLVLRDEASGEECIQELFGGRLDWVTVKEDFRAWKVEIVGSGTPAVFPLGHPQIGLTRREFTAGQVINVKVHKVQ